MCCCCDLVSSSHVIPSLCLQQSPSFPSLPHCCLVLLCLALGSCVLGWILRFLLSLLPHTHTFSRVRCSSVIVGRSYFRCCFVLRQSFPHRSSFFYFLVVFYNIQYVVSSLSLRHGGSRMCVWPCVLYCSGMVLDRIDMTEQWRLAMAWQRSSSGGMVENDRISLFQDYGFGCSMNDDDVSLACSCLDRQQRFFGFVRSALARLLRPSSRA